MGRLRDIAGLQEACRRIKRNGAGLTTNLYAPPAQLEAWAARGALALAEYPGCLLVTRRDRDFQHLYHYAVDPAALGAALEARDAPAVLTADLVGHEEDAAALAALYRAHGFADYRSLFRMVRLTDPARPDDFEDPEVVRAAAEDAPAIAAFLERLLDRFAEQIPEPADIAAAAAAGNILIVRRGQELGGLLIFESAAQTATLRYWFVNDRFRGQGIGARLIKTFFRLCRPVRRIMLWVLADNAGAIAKYQHYGFRAEGLVDRIVIRRERTS